MANKPVRQHTVPRVYLQRFANPKGMLHIYDLEKQQYRQQDPKEATIQKHFYTVTAPDGSKDFTIEEFMSQFVETDFGVVMDRFLKTEKLNPEDKEYLAFFAAFQDLRTPKAREKHFRFMAEANKKITSLMLKMHKAHYGETDLSQKFTEQELDEMIQLLEEERVRIEVPPESHLQHMLEFACQETIALLGQNWIFLRPAKGSKFLTCDHPFRMTRPPNLKGWQGVGLLTPDSAKLIPLDPTMCLMIVNEGNQEYQRTLTREQVREVNLMIATAARRFIIAPDQPLLERIVKSVEYRRSQHGERTK